MTRPDLPPPPAGLPVRRFSAAYESDCWTCGIGIDAGYIADDDRASCDECCNEAEDG